MCSLVCRVQAEEHTNQPGEEEGDLHRARGDNDRQLSFDGYTLYPASFYPDSGGFPLAEAGFSLKR